METLATGITGRSCHGRASDAPLPARLVWERFGVPDRTNWPKAVNLAGRR
jgi:hypothetical protein